MDVEKYQKALSLFWNCETFLQTVPLQFFDVVQQLILENAEGLTLSLFDTNSSCYF